MDLMDLYMGRVAHGRVGGRRAQPLVVNHAGAAVRAVASAAGLALLALTAISALGGAQAARRDTGYLARVAPSTLANGLVTTASGDTIADRRGEDRDPEKSIDASSIAARVREMADSLASSGAPLPTFRSRADSLTSMRTRIAADNARDLRVVISLNDRRLWVLIGPDTLLRAPVAVSTDETLEYAGKTWTFQTPRGVRTVLAKRENPVWSPPDWHYAETAREHNLELAAMSSGKTMLRDGRWLETRDGRVGVVDPDTREFAVLPVDEHIIFDGTMFIPPIGSLNRRIEGQLGDHMLDTGNGFLLHGTPYKASIGTAATHGCIRLRDDDIQWLYEMIPVGTKVYIY
ncbi:MAG: ErfK/YbiS/YcfS/YnhG family protein [Geminicoccaceae bacterium]|nr:ErfK/YbiS/YcfS/YnhG family protein [Geminicoccaceae bacterium]